jgi:adhesin transport system outer membrane protein
MGEPVEKRIIKRPDDTLETEFVAKLQQARCKRMRSFDRPRPVAAVCYSLPLELWESKRVSATARVSRMGVLIAVLSGSCSAYAPPAEAITLRDAVQTALEANPEIGEAVANREATQFELRQARGLYLPQLDFEGRYGAQNFDSPATRLSGTSNDTLGRAETNLTLSQVIFNGFGRQGEVDQQASRVDAASNRVYERSEVIGLNSARQYLEYGRLLRIVQLAEENIRYHRNVLGDVKKGVDEGTLSVADRQLAEDRLYRAEAELSRSRQELNASAIRFYKLIGIPLDRYEGAAIPAGSLPNSLQAGTSLARKNSPLILIAQAELDAAYGARKVANSALYPEIAAELRGRYGDDLDGVYGQETELRAGVVFRWNLYRGGIDIANKQEALRRIDASRFRLDQAYRDVEETLRLAWNQRELELRRLSELEKSLAQLNLLVVSYQEQFKIGERTLLDLLNTQNNKFNTQVAVETSRFDVLFSGYGILAATGTLLAALDLVPPPQASAYARDAFGVPFTPEAETQKRFSPWEPIVTGP